MTELLTAALSYAARGWKVFPCAFQEKRPAPYHWDRSATAEEALVRGWWSGRDTRGIQPKYVRKDGAYNIGLVTGAVSGLVVVDLDDEEGRNVWARLQDAHGQVQTLTARTGTGGYHLLFEHPGYDVKNRVRVVPGLDIRGDGGYIVAAPSIHPDTGLAYEWVDESIPVAPMPLWLLDWVSGGAFPLDGPAGSEAEPVIEAPPAAFPGPSAVAMTRYAEAALRGEAAAVQNAVEGTRNHTLNRAAFNLGTLVSSGALDAITVESTLAQAARIAGLDEKEFTATIRSGMTAGMDRPRQMKPRAPRASQERAAAAVVDAAPADGETPPPPEEPRSVAPSGDPLLYLPLTDAGNAEAFFHLHGDRFRYCVTREKWLQWNGSVWALDITGAAQRKMLETVRARRDAANTAANAAATDQARDALRKLFGFAMASENTAKLNAALKAAQVLEPLATTIDLFDANDWKITAGAQTIDLETGEVYPARPADFISMRTGATYQPGAECPRWVKFLHEIWPDRPEMVAYIQRAAGYLLTGSMKEHAFFLLVGGGRNGKSTMLNILRAVLGDYAGVAAFATFDADKRNDTSNDLAGLRGCRLVTVSETDEDKRLAEARVKGVTGGDPVMCRFLFREFFSYRPTWKVFMAVNHLPAISGTDDGIWSRIHLIRFEQSFIGREDRDLEKTLRGELSGILNWALEGAARWRAEGLNPPDSVKKATESYRADSDTLAGWITDHVVAEQGARLWASDAYQAYKGWAIDAGIRNPMARRKWGLQLQARGFVKAHGERGDYFGGYRLVTNGASHGKEQ